MGRLALFLASGAMFFLPLSFSCFFARFCSVPAAHFGLSSFRGFWNPSSFHSVLVVFILSSSFSFCPRRFHSVLVEFLERRCLCSGASPEKFPSIHEYLVRRPLRAFFSRAKSGSPSSGGQQALSRRPAVVGPASAAVVRPGSSDPALLRALQPGRVEAGSPPGVVRSHVAVQSRCSLASM